jgi:hypothetical protein
MSGMRMNAPPRNAILALDAELAPLLDPLPRCGDKDYCPSCGRGFACPLDTWRLPLGARLLGSTDDLVVTFLKTMGRDAGTGTYVIVCRLGHTVLADAGLRAAYRYWRDAGQTARAQQLAHYGCAAGSRDPVIVEAHATDVAAGGREADLMAALAVIGPTLAQRAGNTDEAWAGLEIRASHIEGSLERRRALYRIDEHGNRVPVRRHHPENPRRTRPSRFLRKV